jgi:sugar phosphate isomerase/epimerase
MHTSICTSFDATMPFARAISLIRQAGFESVALGARPRHSGYDTAEGRATIRRLLTESDLTLDSVHAPFPEGDRLFSLDPDERRESVRQCQVAVDAAAELEGRIVVIHLLQPYDIPHGEERDRMIDEGIQSVGALAAYAAAKGVKLALENGQRRDYDDVLARLLATFTEPHIGFCYDSGHEHVQGTCFRLLEEFGQRLFTVHLHDNRGSDIHVLPYEGTIDWERFRAVFHGLGYGGNLLLEADIKHSAFKDPVIFLAEARKRAGWLLKATDTHGAGPHRDV